MWWAPSVILQRVGILATCWIAAACVIQTTFIQANWKSACTYRVISSKLPSYLYSPSSKSFVPTASHPPLPILSLSPCKWTRRVRGLICKYFAPSSIIIFNRTRRINASSKLYVIRKSAIIRQLFVTAVLDLLKSLFWSKNNNRLKKKHHDRGTSNSRQPKRGARVA